MNKSGSAMVLALVLCLSVLPAAGILAAIARSDLESAWDDYHLARVRRAAWGGLELVKASLPKRSPRLQEWPDPEIAIEVECFPQERGWEVLVTARSERAQATATSFVIFPEGDLLSGAPAARRFLPSLGPNP